MCCYPSAGVHCDFTVGGARECDGTTEKGPSSQYQDQQGGLSQAGTKLSG